MSPINYCQNLWTQFARVDAAQKKCAGVLNSILADGAKSFKSLRSEISNLETELQQFQIEWDRFQPLEDGSKIFMFDYLIMEEIGKWCGDPKPLKMCGGEGSFSVNEVNAAGHVIKLRLSGERFGNQLTVTNLISRLTTLEELEIEATGINDLTALSNISGLKKLAFSTATDFEPLRKLTNLESLSCVISAGNELSPLQDLKKLNQMGVYFSPDAVFSLPENSLPSLKDVTIHGATHDQLSSLLVSAPVEIIELGGFLGSEVVSALENNQTVKRVVIAKSRSTAVDVSVLPTIPNLESLYIYGSKISDLNPLLGLNANCRIALHNNFYDWDKDGDVLEALRERGAEIKNV